MILNIMIVYCATTDEKLMSSHGDFDDNNI